MIFNVNKRLLNAIPGEELLEGFFSLLPGEVASGRDDPTLGIREVLEAVTSAVLERRGAILGFLLLALGLCLLFSAIEMGLGTVGELLPPALCAFSLALGIPLFAVVRSLASAGESLAMLFSGILPVFTSVSLSLGCVNLASAEALGLALTASLLGGGGEGVLSVFSPLLFLLALLSPLNREGGFDLGGALGYIFTRGMAILTLFLGGFLSLQTAVASAADSLTLRATRLAVSSAIPVVGGAVSGAVSSLAGGLSYVSGTVGGFSAVAFLSVALAPLIIALLYRLCLWICLGFLRASGALRTCSAVSALCRAFDSVIAAFALTLAVYLLEAIAFAKALPGSVG